VLSVSPAMLEPEDITDSRIELINEGEMPVADYEAELLKIAL
jgi:hypothetical protein